MAILNNEGLTLNNRQVVVHSQLINGGVDVLTQGLKDRGLEPSVFVGKGQPGVTESSRQQGVQNYLSGKNRVIVISGAGSEGLNLNNTTMVASLDGHFNPERILQAEARGVRADSLLHRPQERRQILAKRYITAIPEDTAKGFIGNIKKFFGLYKKPVSTDEWIHSIAKKKHELNTQFKDVFGKAAQAEDKELIKIAADYCCELNDLLERLFRKP